MSIPILIWKYPPKSKIEIILRILLEKKAQTIKRETHSQLLKEILTQ